MRVALVHNAYGTYSGEEAVVQKQASLLREHGHEVIVHWRGGDSVSERHLGRLRACFTGVISPRGRLEIRQLLREHSPNVVNIHNLFPLISPYVLPEFSKQSIPTVMSIHNYRLVCPIGLHMSKRTLDPCDRCCGGREYWCILRNCEDNLGKSIGYALRNWVARRFNLFRDNVAVYACLTQFQRQRLIDAGFPADRAVVIPNMAHDTYPDLALDDLGTYVGYLGRLSPEKGVDKLIAAAKNLQHIPFQAAGAYGSAPHLTGSVSKNFQFVGFLDREVVPQFLLGCRFTVLCSTWYEGCPLSMLEAMMMGRPVVASRIGAIPEVVEDHVTGLLFEPGNVEDLTEKIQYLWDHPGLCRQLGRAAREKALREYAPEKYYERLIAAYAKAIQLGPPRGRADRAGARSGAGTSLPGGSDDRC
jgi:glycosyltransferase involved in cell wall biosynthesis